MDEGDINDELTIEGMLEVIDRNTGKKDDVRAMLGITENDIKDEKLKEALKPYAMDGSRNIGYYFQGLDILEFDMGEVGEDTTRMTSASNVSARRESWADWWSLKSKQNEMLKEAII